MKKKPFKLSSGQELDCAEATVGNIRAFKKESEEDEFEAGITFLKKLTGKEDKFFNKFTNSDMVNLIEFACTPGNWEK